MTKRPKIEDFFEHFKGIIPKFKTDNEKYIKDLKERGLPEKNGGWTYEGIANNYKLLAVGEVIYNKDYIKAKEYFYLSAKISEYLLLQIEKKDERISLDFASMHEYKSIYLALLSDNEGLAVSLAKLLGGRPKAEEDDYNVFRIVGYLLKYLLLNQEELLTSYLEKLEKQLTKKNDGYDTALLKTYKAIYKKDLNEIEEGLKNLLKSHKKVGDFKHTENEFVSIEVLGILKLLKKRGITIDISNELVPMEFLEEDKLTYPEIDYFV